MTAAEIAASLNPNYQKKWYTNGQATPDESRRRVTPLLSVARLGFLLTAAVVLVACGSRPPVECAGSVSSSECVAAADTALGALSQDLRGRVLRATVRPSTVESCLAAPGCQPLVDVDFQITGTAKATTVTVSRLPDGRLVAETY